VTSSRTVRGHHHHRPASGSPRSISACPLYAASYLSLLAPSYDTTTGLTFLGVFLKAGSTSGRLKDPFGGEDAQSSPNENFLEARQALPSTSGPTGSVSATGLSVQEVILRGSGKLGATRPKRCGQRPSRVARRSDYRIRALQGLSHRPPSASVQTPNAQLLPLPMKRRWTRPNPESVFTREHPDAPAHRDRPTLNGVVVVLKSGAAAGVCPQSAGAP
jgi:hypothetical protein